MTGGGSGGHITPILAVAHELNRIDPSIEIIYVGQKGDGLLDVPQADPNISAVYTVQSGKFRRYSGEGWQQVLDFRTQYLNIRDAFRVLIGIWQSFFLLRKLHPDIIFTRGGFVSVPVALGGRLNRILYITHDSDIVPSLANRLIAKGAVAHAVAFPVDYYPYPVAKTEMVGIPVSDKYVPVTKEIRAQYRKELKLDGYKQMIFITGGGNGAQRLNGQVVANARYLLGKYPDLVLVHVTGRGHEDAINQAYDGLYLQAARSRIVVYGFVHNLYRYSGAADVILTRGGATNMAEFAIQRAACVIVPSEQLSWNVKNNNALAARHAIKQLSEAQADQPERLGRLLAELLDNPAVRTRLGNELAVLARPDAAVHLANMLLEKQQGGRNATRQK